MLGCTQRENTNVFDRDQIHRIKHICIQEIEKKEPAEISLKGIGIVGNQIFIQGFPQNRNWEELRASLGERLVNAGESPILYADKSPVHMNIIRIVDAAPNRLSSLYKVISQLRDVELGTIKHVVWIDKMECRQPCSGDLIQWIT